MNISVQAANLSNCRIESNRIETFLPELECSTGYSTDIPLHDALAQPTVL